MALARIDRLSFGYPGGHAALDGVSLELHEGEVVALLGPSGCGKSTLLRALAGLVPHFHGGRFSGSVTVAGRDTRKAPPAELAGTVATVFQDPEDQVVLARVRNEVAFGLENVETPVAEIWPRADAALGRLGLAALAERPVTTLSGGELQRLCLASAFALEPRLLLLDEPTSQLDDDGADRLVAELRRLGSAVVLSEHRLARALRHCDRVIFLEAGRILVDAPREEALAWLARERPEWGAQPAAHADAPPGDVVATLEGVSFAYAEPLLEDVTVALRRGEVVGLTGANGSGKSTLARIAAGLVAPAAGRVAVSGRACYLSQEPGRYLVSERVLDEVALAAPREIAGAALAAVGLAGFEERHPRDLSSGERERLALACVLAPDPDLLVLDEPTRGVDPPRKHELARLLRVQAPGRATLLVTHDHELADAVCDRTLRLTDGQVEHSPTAPLASTA